MSKRYKNMKSGASDLFQTPEWALGPILPFLPEGWIIWEPCYGKGHIARELTAQGKDVISSDVDAVNSDVVENADFLTWSPPPKKYDCIITNPPFSIVHKFLGRAYALGKPFAFLMPISKLGARHNQVFFQEYGIEVVFLPRRVNFHTPSGKKSSAWFPVCWVTWGLHLPSQMHFWDTDHKYQLRLF